MSILGAVKVEVDMDTMEITMVAASLPATIMLTIARRLKLNNPVHICNTHAISRISIGDRNNCKVRTTQG